MHIYAHLCTFMQASILKSSFSFCHRLVLPADKANSQEGAAQVFPQLQPLIPGFNLKTWNQSFIQFNLHLISIKPPKFTALQVLKTAASFYGHAKLFQCQRWEENE